VRYQDLPQASAAIDIAAPPESVWRWVSDIALMAELSEELRSVEWLDEVTAPAVGARFRGTSFHPSLGEWTTVSTVTECEPGKRFTWTVYAGQDDHRPSSTWSFELTPTAAGTRLKQTGLIGPAARV
jgi:ligand-binding SRPBCC domain-containing protein